MDDSTAIRIVLIVCVADLILGSILAAGNVARVWELPAVVAVSGIGIAIVTGAMALVLRSTPPS